jgi:hypothetical protein
MIEAVAFNYNIFWLGMIGVVMILFIDWIDDRWPPDFWDKDE